MLAAEKIDSMTKIEAELYLIALVLRSFRKRNVSKQLFKEECVTVPLLHAKNWIAHRQGAISIESTRLRNGSITTM
jgi:hypothetical protein